MSNLNFSLVDGFIANLSGLSLTIKLPKPRISILCPFDNDNFIILIIESNWFSTSTFVNPVFFETSNYYSTRKRRLREEYKDRNSVDMAIVNGAEGKPDKS